MIGRLVGAILIVVLLVGIVVLISNNLNTRFDEFARPTGEDPWLSVGIVGVIVSAIVLLVAVIAMRISGGKSGTN